MMRLYRRNCLLQCVVVVTVFSVVSVSSLILLLQKSTSSLKDRGGFTVVPPLQPDKHEQELTPTKTQQITVYEGGNPVDVVSTTFFDDDPVQSYNFSIVCVVERENLFYVKQLEEMWPGPISIAVLAPVDPMQLTVFSSRVRAAVVETNELVSINYLRNIAINITVTTHYLVVDSGTLIDASLNKTLHTLPATVLDSSTAVILPLFFTTSAVRGCRDNETCVIEQRELLPRSKNRIKEHIALKKLQMRRSTHRYLYIDWFFLNRDQVVQRVSCFDQLLQQPFVLLRHARSVPLFSDQFVDNPFNRIQHIEHLRLRGFQFYILGHSFGYILPSGQQSSMNNSQAKEVFIRWFDSVKNERIGDRTRVCSERERKERLEYNLELIKRNQLTTFTNATDERPSVKVQFEPLQYIMDNALEQAFKFVPLSAVVGYPVDDSDTNN